MVRPPRQPQPLRPRYARATPCANGQVSHLAPASGSGLLRPRSSDPAVAVDGSGAPTPRRTRRATPIRAPASPAAAGPRALPPLTASLIDIVNLQSGRHLGLGIRTAMTREPIDDHQYVGRHAQ